MAKLSARGRTELLRVEIEGADTDYFINRKQTYALMSDGSLLVKETARHKPDQYYPKGKPQVWNWRVAKKYKKDSLPKVLQLLHKHFTEQNYTVTFYAREWAAVNK
jgi:hypothetical protein